MEPDCWPKIQQSGQSCLLLGFVHVRIQGLEPKSPNETQDQRQSLTSFGASCAPFISLCHCGVESKGRDYEICVSLRTPDKMSIEIKKEIQLEIAHVLFIDIVGYSKLSINDQHAAVEELNSIVRASEQFQRAEAANRLIRIPTGDGMVLVFYTNPEAPVQCAVEISRVLQEHPRLQLRMGIHSGPVSGVVDVNERANLTGAGINMAQRVMDCGDAGHILLSKHVAEDLEEYEQVATVSARSRHMRSETWRARLGGEPLRRSIRQCEATAEL